MANVASRYILIIFYASQPPLGLRILTRCSIFRRTGSDRDSPPVHAIYHSDYEREDRCEVRYARPADVCRSFVPAVDQASKATYRTSALRVMLKAPFTSAPGEKLW